MPATVPTSYADVFTAALQGDDCHVVGLAGQPQILPVRTWRRPASASDVVVIAHCRGETLDVGCGPGRMTRALAERGHLVLGIDVVPEAVRMTLRRGGLALVRDVFGPLPGEGRWESALLADGNIGIGGDPRALLLRLRTVLAPGGRVVVDLAAPGEGVRTRAVRLETPMLRSQRFPWAVVGVDAIGFVAAGAGFSVLGVHVHDSRWFAVLTASR